MKPSPSIALKYFLLLFCLAVMFRNAYGAENILESDLKAFDKLIRQVEKLVKQKEPRDELKTARKGVGKVRDLLKKGRWESALQEMKNVLWRFRRIGIKGLVQSSVWILVKMGAFTIEKKTDSDLYVVKFQTPEGRIFVYIPGDVAAGDPISASVLAQDPGSGYTVQVDQEKLALQKQKAWKITGHGPSLRVALLEELGSEVVSTEIPWGSKPNEIAAIQSGEEPPPPEPVIDMIPYLRFRLSEVVQSGGTMTIEGPFDGDYSTSRVEIADVAAPVLAESYQEVIVKVPFLQGQTKVIIQENNFSAICFLRLAPKLEAASPRVNCRPLGNTWEWYDRGMD